jgi:hypothetical protein
MRRKNMAFLHVDDVPNTLYERISKIAEIEHKSINQQVLSLLEIGLNKTGGNSRRLDSVFQEIDGINLANASEFPDPSVLIREDRDR